MRVDISLQMPMRLDLAWKKCSNVSRILNLYFSNVPQTIELNSKVRRNSEKGSSLYKILTKNIFLASKE